jgi:hypothetical protein
MTWIIGTPITTADLSGVLLNVRRPIITEVYDEAVPQKRRATRMVESQCAFIQMNMLDGIGKDVNLEQYGFITANPQAVDASISLSSSSGSSTSSSDSASSAAAAITPITGTVTASETATVVARFREATLREKSIYEVDAVVMDPITGLVRASVPPQITGDAGVYLVEFGVLDANACLIFANQLFLYNEPSGWGAIGGPHPPYIDDIRLSLRDNDPSDNLLLDNYDFDLAEICHATLRTVQFWNDQPPPIAGAVFTTKAFPFREIWLQGIQLYLFQLAEEHYRRNTLRHVAGGATIDDKARHHDYNSAWKERYASFRQLVMHRKAQLNANGGYSSLRSGYSLAYDI